MRTKNALASSVRGWCSLAAAALVLSACGGNGNQGTSSSTVSVSSSSVPPVASSSGSSSRASESLEYVYAINVGGSDVSADGVQYFSDRFFTGGDANSTEATIAGTDSQALFQTERYGSYSYEVPVTEASYTVELHFVEMYQTEAGARSFNLLVEGVTVFTGMDLFAEVGGETAYSVTVEGVNVADGSLTVELESLIDNGTLSGIAIYSADGEFVEPPPPPPVEVSDENPGADCAVGQLPSGGSLPSTNGLPDPFVKLDGTRVTSRSEWRCRNEEVRRQAQAYIFGDKPPRPDSVTGTVSNNRISVNASHGGSNTSFNVTVSLPSTGQPPYPAVIGYGGGFFGVPQEMQSTLNALGIAVIEYDPLTLGAENGGGSPGSGGFYDVYGASHSGGLLMAWGWGVSRIIDVLEGDATLIDPTRIGVTGCSRYGKGAFAAGAFDARVALTIPIESGIAGTVSLKMVPTVDPSGEQPSHAINYQRWFSPSVFRSFASATDRLPVDMHQVVGMVAPRGLLVLDNPNEGGFFELAAKSSYGSVVAGREIYRALGAESNISYIGSPGSHCAWRTAYTGPLRDMAAKFLTGDDSANTGQFSTNSFGTVNMDNWINWSTPTLN